MASSAVSQRMFGKAFSRRGKWLGSLVDDKYSNTTIRYLVLTVILVASLWLVACA